MPDRTFCSSDAEEMPESGISHIEKRSTVVFERSSGVRENAELSDSHISDRWTGWLHLMPILLIFHSKYNYKA